MVLTVVVVGNFAADTIDDEKDYADDESDATMLHLHAGPISIFVVDTIGGIECDGDIDDPNWTDVQPPLTMWVRASGTSPSLPSSSSSSSSYGGSNMNGSEIFAGIALPHNLKSSTLCAWRYDLHPTYDDTYSIHVKVLTFDGFVDSIAKPCATRNVPSRDDELFDGQQIQAGADGDEQVAELLAMNAEFVEGLASDGNYAHHRGIRGFKFYGIEDGCCAACSRARNCRMYSIPGALYLDECELYFDDVVDDVDFSDRVDGGVYLGRKRNYSYTRQDPRDFPNIRGRRRELAISSDEIKKTTWPVKMNPLRGFPYQRGANDTSSGGEVSYFLGCGWSSLMSFER